MYLAPEERERMYCTRLPLMRVTFKVYLAPEERERTHCTYLRGDTSWRALSDNGKHFSPKNVVLISV